MSTPTLQKQWVRAAVDLTQMYNDVEGKISKPKPVTIKTSYCDIHLPGPLIRTKVIRAKREKGRKAQGLDAQFIQICWQ